MSETNDDGGSGTGLCGRAGSERRQGEMQEIVSTTARSDVARLYTADDPTIRNLRPEPGADGAQSAPARVGTPAPLRPAPRPIGRRA